MASSTDTILANSDVVALAAEEALGATCGIKMQRCEAPETGDTPLILSVIALVGDIEWSIFLGLPRPAATGLVGKFFGFEIPFEAPDMGDAVGELANILGGKCKSLLDARGIKAELSLPSVVRAENVQVLKQSSAASSRVCYHSDVGELWVGVAAGRSTRLAM